MKYRQMHDGEETEWQRTRAVMCCDCGLVHTYKLRISKGKIFGRAWRNRRATAAARRRKQVKR
jgi:hypothetical protein